MYANAATLPKEAKDFPEFVDWRKFVGDAQGGLKFLAEQSGVDRSRLPSSDTAKGA